MTFPASLRRVFVRSWLAALLLGAAAQPFRAGADVVPPRSRDEDRAAKSDADVEQRAAKFVAVLKLDDAAKARRAEALVATHLKAVRDWHNDHPFSAVPAGINPVNGQKLSDLDRQIIANSAMPKTAHETLLAGLRAELTEPQVEIILDGYTEGKVAFTLAGYRAIVPDLTPAEEAAITGFLKQAREQAIDFKGSKQISAIFEIYKTKSEQFLNANGRNWKALYKAYSDAAKAKKAADAAAKAATK